MTKKRVVVYQAVLGTIISFHLSPCMHLKHMRSPASCTDTTVATISRSLSAHLSRSSCPRVLTMAVCGKHMPQPFITVWLVHSAGSTWDVSRVSSYRLSKIPPQCLYSRLQTTSQSLNHFLVFSCHVGRRLLTNSRLPHGSWGLP